MRNLYTTFSVQVSHHFEKSLKPFIIAEIQKAIKLLKPNKAPESNLITDRVLKELPEEGIRYLVQL